MALSSHTLVPWMNNAPRSVDLVSSPANRSPVFAASDFTAASCDSPSTLIPRNGRSLSLGHVVDVFCTQNDTNGGSRETGTKVLAASPTRTPSTSAAIAMTPGGKCPYASRRDAGLSSMPLISTPYSHVTVSGCHVRMSPQPALPRIPAVDREDPFVGRIDADAAGMHGQVVGQLEHRHGGVESRVEEVGHRDALTRRQAHPVFGGAQISAAGDLEHLADVDDERARKRIHVDPLTCPISRRFARPGVISRRFARPGWSANLETTAPRLGQ